MQNCLKGLQSKTIKTKRQNILFYLGTTTVQKTGLFMNNTTYSNINIKRCISVKNDTIRQKKSTINSALCGTDGTNLTI